MRPFRLAFACLALAPTLALAEDAPPPPAATFMVLKIVQGDDTTFKVVPEKDVKTEKDRLLKDAKDAVKAWETARDTFLSDKANRGKDYLEPKPAMPSVSNAKEKIASEADAKKFAEEEQKKAEGKYAVIRVTDTDGKSSLETIRMNKIRSREAELKRKYAKDVDAWQKKIQDLQAKQAGSAAAAGGGDVGYGGGGGGGAAGVNTQKMPPHPAEPKVTKLKDGFADRDEAEKALAELEKSEKKPK